ncbi:MAG: hypothetical protein QOI66_647 [Myxococcales bacterium]|jgi:hypothetical protein|nr:hypothetical protein [Myxococcales bacterium]
MSLATRMVSARNFALATLLILISSAAQAADQAPHQGTPTETPGGAEPEARRLAAEGMRLFTVGDYQEAIRAFKASYLRVPVPGLLYNMAQAHRLLGHCPEATVLYRQLAANGSAGTLRGLAQDRLTEMGECPAAPAVPSFPAAASPSQRQPPGTAPRPPESMLSAVPPEPAPSPSHSHLGRRIAVVGTGVCAGALAIASVWFGRQARSDQDRVSHLFDTGGMWSPAFGAADQDGRRHEQYAYLSAAGSLVLGGVAAWLGLRRWRE